MKQKLELLAPAGSPESLDAAVGEGADAVYLGLKDFNARLRSTNFTYGQFEAALRSLRRMKKKVYVTVNTVFEQREADRMYQFLKYLAAQGPDAIIVQDFGVVEMVRTQFPSLRLHASTQMNIASARGANALSRHGVSRVVLARELSLEELRGIRRETNLELEVFVHGALCISVSGLCLFSSYLGGKSANRGMCTQACRRLYHCADREDESGYYFSPNDLQLLEHIPDLASAGINSFKIEGRMKSASYVGTVVSAYRLVTDAVLNGDSEDEMQGKIETALGILRNDFARPKTQYFYDRKKITTEFTELHGEKYKDIDWLNPAQDGGTGISLGQIISIKGSGEDKRALIFPPHGVTVSERDTVRIHYSDDSGRVSHKLLFAKKDGNGFWISIPKGSIGDNVYLIQTKEKNRHYAKIISGNVNSKGPGRDKAPVLAADNQMKQTNKNKNFPEGLYVAVSKPDDLFILQSSRPHKVILDLSQKNIRHMLADNKQPLPFKTPEIILNLDPWFPQETAENKNGKIAGEIGQLIEAGYTQYMLNNLGHFSLFKNYDNVKLLAGPWLYVFNSWSLSFLASYGVEGFASPLENNRQNLERTLTKEERKEKKEERREKNKKEQNERFLHSKCFITVFAHPRLFNIKADLSALNLKTFADNRDETFSLKADRDGSHVYPESYFSIIDKIPFLKEAGFKRFIIDLTGSTVKKANYKDLMKAVKGGKPLPKSNRFNWKNGFYSSV